MAKREKKPVHKVVMTEGKRQKDISANSARTERSFRASGVTVPFETA